MKQALNPYLPLSTYIPDGEPHVFEERVYVFGSHDKEGGDAFCMLDYEVFSAPVTDLTDWRSEGIIYRAKQDPTYSEKYKYMYAPDVVQGNDGRYYIYYSLSGGTFTGPMHVAVCDTPAGKYDYYGEVKNADGTTFNRNITFDPGLINDNGVIRLYYGWAIAVDKNKKEEEQPQELPEEFKAIFENVSKEDQMRYVEMQMFGKTMEEIEREPYGIQGANVVVLADDMLTVISEPSRIVPGQFAAAGTLFEEHSFFEASSIRKIGDTYYFIYSSELSHELCYATSKYPDKDFVYGGTIISNGDIGLEGRTASDRLAATGNNHGSIECINGEWYIFYHRQTHKTSYSRQGCAEKITILPDGSIKQVEMTSCGLNRGPLVAQGEYPAVMACNLTNGAMPHIEPSTGDCDIPYITNEGEERFITDIKNETLIGFKYFSFNGDVCLEICVQADASGEFEIYAGDELAGKIAITPSDSWKSFSENISIKGVKPLYLKYFGERKVKFLSFTLNS